MGDEVELKYSVASSPELEQLVEGLAADGVEVGPWREFEMRDRYLDTADGALGRAGYGARIRKTSDGTVLALKRSRNVGADGRRRKGSSGAGAGAKGAGAKQASGNGVGGNAAGGRALHRRAEYEAPAGPGRDPSRWPESEARALLEAELKGAELRERFVLQQVRRERDVSADGSRAVLSLDRTTVRLGRRRLGTFETLEVELREGDEALLGTLAGRLEASGLVDPQPASKEQLAQAMVDAARRLPPVPSSPGITPEDPLAEAGRKVLAMHLARMLSREAGSRSGDDMEDVHKMRVATRRMRAAWRVFEDAYRPKRAKRYVAELKAVAAALGGVRDLDVLLGHVGGYGASLAREGDGDADAAAGLDPLVAHWRRAREQAREGLIRTLDSAAYHAFVDDYLEFVATAGAGGVQVEANAPSRVRDTAP
nr:CHAD domain-containing protein [Chloroflexota bacterium]